MWAFHSGQICTAPTRVIAQRGVYDQSSAACGSRRTLKVGDPLEPDTVLGPVIIAPHRDRVEAYVRAGADEGGEIVAGGERPDMRRRFYVAPTLIADCKAGMKVVQEEIFGPVVVVVPFDDEDEGVALANGTDFGLYDYVFSADTARPCESRSSCGPATSASTPRSATTRRPSAGSSSRAWAATVALRPARVLRAAEHRLARLSAGQADAGPLPRQTVRHDLVRHTGEERRHLVTLHGPAGVVGAVGPTAREAGFRRLVDVRLVDRERRVLVVREPVGRHRQR